MDALQARLHRTCIHIECVPSLNWSDQEQSIMDTHKYNLQPYNFLNVEFMAELLYWITAVHAREHVHLPPHGFSLNKKTWTA